MMYIFGPYQLDTSLPLLLRNGETVSIPPRALAGLILLVERRNSAVSKSEMMDALWPDAFVEEGSLTQLVSTLRKSLGGDFPEGSPIQTIPKVGYRFVAEVLDSTAASPLDFPSPKKSADLIPPNPQPAGVESPATLPVPIPVHTYRVVAGALCAVVLLTALTAVLLHRGRAKRLLSSSDGHQAVAVLPFQDLAQAKDTAWVGVAVQEMLTTDLRMHKGVRVPSADDINHTLQQVHWTGTADPGPETLRELGSDLNCDHAVVGAYLVKGNRIHLDLRVVNLLSGESEQESSFEQPEQALLPMLAAVGDRAASSLGITGDTSGQSRALTSGLNPAAYKLYAEGVARNRLYDFKGAINDLQQSTAADPTFPLAHLELSLAWTARGQEKQAAVEAERAVQLSSQLPREQQLVIQARMQSVKHQYASAAETYRALYSFYPDNREYGRLLVQSLSTAGKNDQAVSITKELLDRGKGRGEEPLLDSVIADMYSNMGDWQRSLDWATRGADESRRRGATLLYERLLTTESQANVHMRRYPAAESQTREALALGRQLSDVSGELRALNRLGEIAIAQHKWKDGQEALLSALQIERTSDQAQRETHTLLTLSKLTQQSGDLKMAGMYAEQASTLAKQLGLVEVVTEAKLQHALLKAAGGEPTAARTLLAQVESEAGQIGDSYLLQQAHQARQSLQMNLVVGERR